PPRSTLFPYTTLFRSSEVVLLILEGEAAALRVVVATRRELVEISKVEIAAEVQCRAEVVVLRMGVARDRNRLRQVGFVGECRVEDRKSTRLNSSHDQN